MIHFFKNYGLKNLIRQPTCYKNPSNLACIGLILTNVPGSFQSTCVVDTGISDFHLMSQTVIRKGFKKCQPKIINHRPYQNFSNEACRETLMNNLSKENFIKNEKDFRRLCHISIDALNKHAPCKKKHPRGSQMLFFKKNYRKQSYITKHFPTKYE